MLGGETLDVGAVGISAITADTATVGLTDAGGAVLDTSSGGVTLSWESVTLVERLVGSMGLGVHPQPTTVLAPVSISRVSIFTCEGLGRVKNVMRLCTGVA